MARTKKQDKIQTQEDEQQIEVAEVQVQDEGEIYYVIKNLNAFNGITQQNNTIKAIDLHKRYNINLIEKLFLNKGFLRK